MQLEEIIGTAIGNKASDIHLTVGVPPIVRVNGRLLHVGSTVLMPDQTEAYARQILGDAHYREFEESGEYTRAECAKRYSFRSAVPVCRTRKTFRSKNPS